MNLVRTDHGVAVDTGTGGFLPLRYVMAIGRNYAEHAKELGNAVPDRPVVFTKSPFSIALHDEEIIIPRICQDQEQVDYEAELAVIIGTSVRDVPMASALSHVLGYCCANDVSARWVAEIGVGRSVVPRQVVRHVLPAGSDCGAGEGRARCPGAAHPLPR